MNVSELIEVLQTLDPLAMVVRQAGPESDSVVLVKAANLVEIVSDSTKYPVYRIAPGSPKVAILIE